MSIPPEQAEDWADELAARIIQDIMDMPTRPARTLIAARLRIVKTEGRIQGRAAGAESVCSTLERLTRTLQ